MCFALWRGFCVATLPQSPDWWWAAVTVVLLELCPISTQDIWSSVRVSIESPLLLRSFSIDCTVSPGNQLLVESWLCQTSSISELWSLLCSWEPSVQQKQSCLWALQAVPFTSRLGFCSDMHREANYREVCIFPEVFHSILEWTHNGMMQHVCFYHSPHSMCIALTYSRHTKNSIS